MPASVNLARRNLLKTLGLGSLLFLASRVVGGKLFSEHEQQLSQFKLKEQKDKLVFYNAKGKQLMKLSQNGELVI